VDLLCRRRLWGPNIERIGNVCPGPTVSVTCDPANPHYAGASTDLSTSGFSASAASSLHLEAVDGPPFEFGFFMVSPGATAFIQVESGILCLQAPTGRYNVLVASNQSLPQLNSIGQFDANGTLQNLAGTSNSGSGFDVPLELPYSPPGLSISPGETWNFQLWHRDQVAPFPNPGSSANFSNVVQVTFP
jgi:hypothetical protein